MKNWRFILFGVGFMVLALCCGLWMLGNSQQVYAGIEDSPMESAIFGFVEERGGAAEEARIWTDKADYPSWGAPVISGAGFASNAKVTLTVADPNGHIAAEGIVTTDGTGNFQARFTSPSGLQTGTYEVSATDGTNTATTSFTDVGECLEVTKVAKVEGVETTSVAVGQVIEYTVYVANKGPPPVAMPILFQMEMEGSTMQCGFIYDSLVGDLMPYLDGNTDDHHDMQLDPGEVWTFSYTYTVTDSDTEPLVNIVFAVGMYIDPISGYYVEKSMSDQMGDMTEYMDMLNEMMDLIPSEAGMSMDINSLMMMMYSMGIAYDYDLIAMDIIGQDSLDITKTADVEYAYFGDTITYTVTITNNIPDCSISDVVVYDTLMGELTNPTGDNGNGLLDYGETWTYTYDYVVGEYENHAFMLMPMMMQMMNTSGGGSGMTFSEEDIMSFFMTGINCSGYLCNYAMVMGQCSTDDGGNEEVHDGCGGCGGCMPGFLHCFGGCGCGSCGCGGYECGGCDYVYDFAKVCVEILKDGEISQILPLPPEIVFDYCGFVISIDWFGTVRQYPCTVDGALCANVLMSSPDGNSILHIPFGTMILNPDGTPAFENKDPDLVGMIASAPPPTNGAKVLRIYRLVPDGVVFKMSSATIIDRFTPAEAAGGQLAWAYYDAKASKWVEITAPGTIAGGYTLIDAVITNVADAAAPYFAIIVK